MALITHKQYLSGTTLWPSSHTNSIFPVPHYGPHHTQTVSFWYHTMDLNTKPQYFSGTAKLAWRYKHLVFPVPHYDPRYKTTVFFYGPEHKTTVSFWHHPISSTQNHSILLAPPYILHTKTQYPSGTTLYPQHKNTVSFWHHPISSTQKHSILLAPPYILNITPQYPSGTTLYPQHKNTVSFWHHLYPQHKNTVSFWYHPISSTQKHCILLVPPYILNTKPQYLSGTMGTLPVHYFVQLVGMIRYLVASQDSARAAHFSHDLLR